MFAGAFTLGEARHAEVVIVAGIIGASYPDLNPSSQLVSKAQTTDRELENIQSR